MTGNSERANDNFTPSLRAKSNAADNADVVLWSDPTTHRLLVDASVSITLTTDNSAFTAGTSGGTPAFGFYHSTIDTVTDGRAAALAIDSKRNLFVVVRDAAGNARGLNVDASGGIAIAANSSVNVAQINGVTVLMGNGVTGTGSQRVTIASDNTPFAVKIDQTTPGTTNLVALAANQSVNVAQMNGVTVTMGNGAAGTGVQRVTLANDSTGVLAGVTTVTTVTSITGGGVAHDGADSGNPIKVGGRAVSAEIAPVANNDRSDFVTDLTGKQIVMPYANPENFVSGAITSAMTGTTSTSLIAAPASGLRNYITNIVVSNSHATVGTDVIIQDGSGGTTLYVIPAAAVFGGASVTFPVPLRQPTTATAIYCANVTTGANTKVSASGYKGA